MAYDSLREVHHLAQNYDQVRNKPLFLALQGWGAGTGAETEVHDADFDYAGCDWARQNVDAWQGADAAEVCGGCGGVVVVAAGVAVAECAEGKIVVAVEVVGRVLGP